MFKKLPILMLILISLPLTVNAFIDTENHWAKDEINYSVRDMIIDGYEDGYFRPDKEIKVNEFLKILVTASGKQKIMVGERWPDWFINTAIHYDWISENEFDNYERSITRYEAAKILANYIDVSDVKASRNNLVDLDEPNRKDILKLITLNVVNGYEDNTFRGGNTITRAEAVKLVNKAIKARRTLVIDRDCELTNHVSNIGKENADTFFINRYEIKNNKLYFYDNGRFARLDDYKLDEKYINHSKVIKLIKTLINEDGFVSVNYAPDKDTINQLSIKYGDRPDYLSKGSLRFDFTFYEDKPYELRRIKMQDSFSEKISLRIRAEKLWVSLSEVDDGSYINENQLKLFKRGIAELVNDEVADMIGDYTVVHIAETYDMQDKKIVETIKCGKYTIDIYARGTSGLEFYIS